MKKLRLANIQRDTKLTPRSDIDKATVASYAASYEQLPPVDVFWIESKDGWWLVDGNHRFEAAKQLKLKTMDCTEHQGTMDDAIEFSYDANMKHGKPLNQKERKAGAILKLKLHSERNNSWIAEDCGVDYKSVEGYRVSLEQEQEIPVHEMLVSRKLDGDGNNILTPRKKPQNGNGEEEKPATEVKLFHGDMLKLLKNGKFPKFDLVVTDPPYGVTEYTAAGQAETWDKLDTKKWLKAIIPHLQKQYHLFWFCSPTFAADIEMIFRELELPIKSRIVWHRRNMAMGSKAKDKFIDTWEMCFHVGNKPLKFDDNWSDAWFDVQIHAVPQTQFRDQKLHPTQKPIELIKRLVEYGSDHGDNVLDPFAGSGTTGFACQELERNCTLMEIEAEFIGTIQARLNIREDSKAQ